MYFCIFLCKFVAPTILVIHINVGNRKVMVPFFSRMLKYVLGLKFVNTDKYTVEIIQVYIYPSQMCHVAYQNDQLDVIKHVLLWTHFLEVTGTVPLDETA